MFGPGLDGLLRLRKRGCRAYPFGMLHMPQRSLNLPATHIKLRNRAKNILQFALEDNTSGPDYNGMKFLILDMIVVFIVSSETILLATVVEGLL
jgi:hypothetical protein